MSATAQTDGELPSVTLYVGDLPEFKKRGIEFAKFTLTEVYDASDAENFNRSLERIHSKRMG